MHNIASGNMLCTTLNAMVAAQQEHNGIVREGMATQARLFRTALASEKQKVVIFTKHLRRTGARLLQHGCHGCYATTRP